MARAGRWLDRRRRHVEPQRQQHVQRSDERRLGGHAAIGRPHGHLCRAATGNLVANGLFDLNGNAASVNALSGSGTIGDSTFTSPTLTFGNNNANSTFSGTIGVSGGIRPAVLNKAGGGMVVFSGTNNATAVTVSQGTLQVTNSSALGTGTYAVNSGSLYLNYAAAAAPTWANISGSGTLELNSAQTVTGLANWTPGGFLSLPSGFTGTLQLDNGRVSTTPYGLGSAASVVISNSAQFLAYDGTNNGTPYTFPQNFSISGMGWGESGYNNGAPRVSGMNATFSGSISLTGDSGLFNQVNGGTLDVTGVISGVHGLSIYTNGSPIIMAGANTYSGTTAVTVGALMLSNSSALENSTLTTGGIIFDAAAGGEFTFGGLSGAARLS